VSYKNQWRVLVGDWRVLYIIDDAAKVVSIYVDCTSAGSLQIVAATPALVLLCPAP
jgi:hypothetical protein